MTPKAFQIHRNALGLTRPQMADILGVSIRTVQRWESGERAISRPVGLAISLLDYCCEIKYTGKNDFCIKNKFLDKLYEMGYRPPEDDTPFTAPPHSAQ